MGDYAIHEASEEERTQAVQVRIRVFVDIQGFPLEEEVDDLDQVARHIVILDGDKVIGTLRILNSEEVAKIGRVVILPEYQGKGLGRKLMEYAENYVAASGEYSNCKFTKLGSQYDKREFYQKCGYVEKGDIYDELGCPHVWMYKPISRG
ncbi:Acetyltransferase (GNAT) domain [Dipsacomyces acuminosporus]|nr:Acetyltransferase (GNAT) domain [Dipsacomyces acuminosporus]